MFGWFRRCAHERVRCVHGDEIIALGFRRAVCLDCGRALDVDLPAMCFYTDKPHPSAVPESPCHCAGGRPCFDCASIGGREEDR